MLQPLSRLLEHHASPESPARCSNTGATRFLAAAGTAPRLATFASRSPRGATPVGTEGVAAFKMRHSRLGGEPQRYPLKSLLHLQILIERILFSPCFSFSVSSHPRPAAPIATQVANLFRECVGGLARVLSHGLARLRMGECSLTAGGNGLHQDGRESIRKLSLIATGSAAKPASFSLSLSSLSLSLSLSSLSLL